MKGFKRKQETTDENFDNSTSTWAGLREREVNHRNSERYGSGNGATYRGWRVEDVERDARAAAQRIDECLSEVGVYYHDIVTVGEYTPSDPEPSVRDTPSEQQEPVRPDVERSRAGSESFHARLNVASRRPIRFTT